MPATDRSRATEAGARPSVETGDRALPWREVDGDRTGPPGQADPTRETSPSNGGVDVIAPTGETPTSGRAALEGGRYPASDLRTEVWDRYPGEYRPPTADQQRALTSGWEGSKDPTGWADDINPGREALGRRVNCADCTRATESTWRGNPQVAAERLPQNGRYTGENPRRIEEWAGDKFQPASVQEIGGRLEQMGPGSSAMAAVYWDRGGGHAFNAINDQGTVRYVDGQTGRTGAWPPPWGDRVRSSYAIFRGPEEDE